MIKAIFIMNTAGKVRLVRVFDDTVSRPPVNDALGMRVSQ